MDKILIIVESPHKAETIQKFLGDNYIVLASKGHIVDLAKGGRHGIGIDIENNFKPKYVLIEDKIATLDMLMDAAKKCDRILIGSDNDREGGAIAWHLSQRLEDLGKPMKRIVFSEIKKSVVLKAIENPGEININLFHAQEARRILDRIVGFMASPFLMSFCGPKLSAGRVQSVVTKMVIDREKEIESIVPEEFWTIQVDLKTLDNQQFITKYSKRLSTLISSQDAKLKLSAKDCEYVVSEVISDEEKKNPPAPLVTSMLQQIMSKNYDMDSGRTMKAAQALYESGYCTYIRTDSIRVGAEAIEEVRQFIKSKYDLPKKPNTYKNKDDAQDAHEAIRPSDITLLPNDNYAIIDKDEKLVYEVIWKYFIASQMMPAIYSTLKITAHVKGDKGAEVKASGKALKYKGFLEVLGIGNESKIDIPNLKIGDILMLSGKNPVRMEKKQTQPTPRYSEYNLIKELVYRNIGRPATYAELLSKIASRNYVEKKGNVYHATDLGKKITDILTKHFAFMDYNYTALMETQLDLIEHGKLDHIKMLKDFYPKFKTELNKAYIEHGGCLCDKCGSPMIKRIVKTTGITFLGCGSWPNCKEIKPAKDATVVAHDSI